ncbi:unnamed protein product [Trichogramma brassicae]|uniref:Uncharacterized protein n=1 Tax=Trichogramma brassicae TaxID=86971 RepID=A0A6H5IFG5_9HYME|nr:unnamed protein product [Trichogramma brassicae]
MVHIAFMLIEQERAAAAALGEQIKYRRWRRRDCAVDCLLPPSGRGRNNSKSSHSSRSSCVNSRSVDARLLSIEPLRLNNGRIRGSSRNRDNFAGTQRRQANNEAPNHRMHKFSAFYRSGRCVHTPPRGIVNAIRSFSSLSATAQRKRARAVGYVESSHESCGLLKLLQLYILFWDYLYLPLPPLGSLDVLSGHHARLLMRALCISWEPSGAGAAPLPASFARAWEYRRSRAQTRTRACLRAPCVHLSVCVRVREYWRDCGNIYCRQCVRIYIRMRVGANEVKMSLEKRRTSTTARGGHPWLVSADHAANNGPENKKSLLDFGGSHARNVEKLSCRESKLLSIYTIECGAHATLWKQLERERNEKIVTQTSAQAEAWPEL